MHFTALFEKLWIALEALLSVRWGAADWRSLTAESHAGAENNKQWPLTILNRDVFVYTPTACLLHFGQIAVLGRIFLPNGLRESAVRVACRFLDKEIGNGYKERPMGADQYTVAETINLTNNWNVILI